MSKTMKELYHMLLIGGKRYTSAGIEECRELARFCMNNGRISAEDFEKYSTLCDHEHEEYGNV